MSASTVCARAAAGRGASSTWEGTRKPRRLSGLGVQTLKKIVATVGLWVGVGSGVEVGDRVIIRGAERLAPGQPVEVAAD